MFSQSLPKFAGTFLTFSTISVYSNIQHPAHANLLGVYKEPAPNTSQIVAQRRTVTSGSRSRCESSLEKGSLTLLTPETKKVHLTSSPQPTLYFHADIEESNSFNTNLRFNLVSFEPQSKIYNTITEQKLNLKRAGIHPINLPDEVSLEEDKIYLWQIAIPCQDSDKVAQTIRAAIKLVPIPSNVANQIEDTNSSLRKAQIYAEHSLWYDAISQAQENKHDDQVEYFFSLLREQNIMVTTKELNNYD